LFFNCVQLGIYLSVYISIVGYSEVYFHVIVA